MVKKKEVKEKIKVIKKMVVKDEKGKEVIMKVIKTPIIKPAKKLFTVKWGNMERSFDSIERATEFATNTGGELI